MIENFPTKKIVVDIKLIEPNKWNSNIQSDEMFRKEIESIKRYGFIDPVLVREVAGVYEIIDGEHRLKACRELGYKTLEVLNLGEISDEDSKLLTLTMNNLRGKDDILKRAAILKSLNNGQLQLLPFSKKDIEFEMKLLDFDFSQFDKPIEEEKSKDLVKEVYQYLVKALVVFDKIHEQSDDVKMRLFVEKFRELFSSFKVLSKSD